MRLFHQSARTTRHPGIAWVFLAGFATLTVPATSVLALDGAKVALSLARQAAAAFEQADFARSAKLYRDAFANRPVPLYL